jgi:hypothetical protein
MAAYDSLHSLVDYRVLSLPTVADLVLIYESLTSVRWLTVHS